MHGLEAARLARPTAARLLEGVLRLGRELHLELDERTLAEKFLGTLSELYPGRLIAIRLENDAGRRAVGHPVEPAALAGPLVLKRSSADKTKLDRGLVARGRVLLTASPPPVFAGAHAGFSVPLVAGGEIYGALDVGYAADAEAANDDEPTLIPIANHLSVALRNGRLHAEALVLRDTLQKLVEHADALIIGVGPDWKITAYNRALARITGRDPATVVGRDLRELIPDPDRQRVVREVGECLAGRTIAPVEIDFPSRDGQKVRTVWNLAVVGGGGRPIEAVVAVGQDRTRILSLERQIIQAEKLATLGQLAAGVVHELGNPLTAITVYADYLVKRLERGPLDAGDGEKLHRILDGAERILTFSRSLVQYAAPAPVEKGSVVLNDAVRQALFFCEHIVADGGKIEVELADGLPALVGVRGQLTQVIINLVTNAVHALPAGGGRIRVATGRRDAGSVVVTVEDEGCGIPAADHARIFEPFYTTKTDGKGSGLGLSIVRSIVERHGGSIAVDSRPGRGTIFTVTLPVRVL